MGHANVQRIHIVVAGVLPVDLANAAAHRHQRLHLGKAIERHFLGDGGEIVFEAFFARAEADIDEAARHPVFEREQAELGLVEVFVFLDERHRHQLAVVAEAPCVIGTGDAPPAIAAAAVRVAIEQPCGAVRADIVERSHLPVLAAHHDRALAHHRESMVVACARNVRHMAHEVPGRLEYVLALQRHEIGVEIGPGGQAPAGLIAGNRLGHLVHGRTPSGALTRGGMVYGCKRAALGNSTDGARAP